jgi:hypothetical protein
MMAAFRFADGLPLKKVFDIDMMSKGMRNRILYAANLEGDATVGMLRKVDDASLLGAPNFGNRSLATLYRLGLRP